MAIFFRKEGAQMKKGDTCWFIENNARIIQGTIKSISGNLYTILLPSGGAIRLPKHRIYNTAEEAEKSIKKNISKNKPMSNPYDYWH